MTSSDRPTPTPPALVWTPARLGRIDVKNRLVMAPMTRSRALPSGVPGPHAAACDAQRAGLGLLVSEGTQPSDAGQGQFVLTNPDFVERLQAGAPLDAADRASDFGGKEHGHTDYPRLDTL